MDATAGHRRADRIQPGRFQGRSEATTALLAIARKKALSALRHRSREELHEQGPAAIETNRELIDLVASCGHSADKKSIVSGSP